MKTVEKAPQIVITLKDVRLSFSSIFKPKAFSEDQQAKYSAAFIMDKKKHAGLIKQLEKEGERVAKAKWAGKIPSSCIFGLRDGAEKEEFDGYGEGVMFIGAKNSLRIPVINRDRTPLTAEDNVIYDGCYVNAAVTAWAQDNKFGKRVNFELKGVQFCRDGEPFGQAQIDPNKYFDNLDEEENDDDESLID